MQICLNAFVGSSGGEAKPKTAPALEKPISILRGLYPRMGEPTQRSYPGQEPINPAIAIAFERRDAAKKVMNE